MALDCCIFKSSLFRSDIIDGKKEYLKILVLLYNIAKSSNVLAFGNKVKQV